MKVGLVLDDTLDKTDGVQQYVLQVGKWLSSQGHEVHYLVGQTNRTDIPNIHSLSRNVQVRFNGNGMSTPLPASRAAIRELLDANQFDVLHIQMPYSPVLAGRIILAAPQTTAIVGTFHILPFSRLETTATNLLGVLLRRSLKRFHAVMATSTASAKFVNSCFGMQATVVANPIALADFRIAPPPADGYCNIVFMGRLVPRKGAAELLRAIAILPVELQQQVRVTIGGKGPQLATLESYVQQHGLAEIVSFKGFVPEADKAVFLSAADIAVFPSTSGESFGISLLEGMAAARGVTLGGDNPGYRTVLGEWPDALVNVRDSEVFADRLKHFISDVSARETLHAAQSQAVEQYDIANIGTKVVAQYNTALHQIEKVR